MTQFILHNWYLFAGVAVVLALLAAGPLTRLLHGIKTLTPAQAVQVVNRQGGVVVDVCEANEYKEGHIPRAVHLPLSGLTGRLHELERYKAKPVIVSCRSGNRSVKGAVMLRKQGFATVYSLAGGLMAWQRDNLPVEK